MRVCSAHKAGLDLISSCAARRVGFAAALILAGTQGLQQANAANDTRTISLRHVHTQEDLTITYKKNGQYDEAALKKINWLMRDWRKNQETKMDPEAIDLLWGVYQEVGAKEPIHIIGGYRSPDTNAMLRRRSKGVAKHSQHMLGKAIDFYIPGVSLDAIRAAGLRLQGGGVGFYPTSGSPFVHMDVGSIRHWPRMTRDQLAKVFPDGRTVHLPTDGNPLPGYQLALADIERGVNHRAVASPKKRSLLATLFGGGQDTEETDDNAAAREAPAATRRVAAAAKPAPAAPAPAATAPVAAPAAAPTAKPVMVATAAPEPVEVPVPLPPVRPTYQIASAESRPAPAPAARSATPMDLASLSPNEIINMRGYWQGLPETQAELPRQVADASPAHSVSSARRLPAASTTAALEQETTATVGPFTRPDRVPAELALAYAAQAESKPSRQAPPARMAARTPDAVVTTKGTASIAAKPVESTAQTRSTERLNDPWMRGIVMAQSVQNQMTVTMFGDPDFRGLAKYMQKPPSSVMMTFSHDPHLGMTAEAFTGSAVVFQATVTFEERRTAALR